MAVNNRKMGMGRTALGPSWRPTINSLRFVIAALAGSNYARRAVVYVGASACNPNDQVSFQGVECRDLYKSARNANVPI